jgi:hypothetical protein
MEGWRAYGLEYRSVGMRRWRTPRCNSPHQNRYSLSANCRLIVLAVESFHTIYKHPVGHAFVVEGRCGLR